MPLLQIAKCIVTLLALWREQGYSLSKWRHQLATDYFGRPKELFKMSVPSLAYAIQNNLDFVALANLDPGVYQVHEYLIKFPQSTTFQVTTQLKVVSTAIFMVIMLQRHLSKTRWFSIASLFVGLFRWC